MSAMAPNSLSLGRGRERRSRGRVRRVRTYETARPGATQRARNLRRNATEAEKHLWSALRQSLPQFKWRRQMPIGPYIVDFACFARKLIVELDGGQHAACESDAVRTAFLERQGYCVLRFWNNDVFANTDGVLTAIAQSLSPREREGAAQPRKGEARTLTRSSSPSQPAAGSLPLPSGEGNKE
jgi:very-short-patch-repair endonuclease